MAVISLPQHVSAITIDRLIRKIQKYTDSKDCAIVDFRFHPSEKEKGGDLMFQPTFISVLIWCEISYGKLYGFQ